jgi:hypothetical protein
MTIKSINLPKNEKLGYAWKRFDLDEDDFDLGEFGAEHLKVYATSTANGTYIDVYVVDETQRNSKNRPRVIANIVFSKHKGSVPTYSSYYTRIDNEYMGFDIAPKLYEYLLVKYPGWILKSGTSQSIGGKSIWNRLAKSRKVSVFAVNNKTEEQYICSYSDTGEVDCPIDVYSSSGYHLYAIRNQELCAML